MIGASNEMKGQFLSTAFTINNSSGCTVDVFFEFMNGCPGIWYCCAPAYVVNVPAFTSITISVIPGEDALIRVYPYGWCAGGTGACAYYFGDFTTSSGGSCYSPSTPAGTPVSGDDCNGFVNGLTAAANGSCGSDCMDIW